jgi:hypothetical protein
MNYETVGDKKSKTGEDIVVLFNFSFPPLPSSAFWTKK